MPRYALKIEYNGQPFAGWQRQDGPVTVQEVIEKALERLDADHPGIGGAGRTDTGVHALGQVAHCDLSKSWDPFRLSEALNYHLKPHPVAVLDAAAVDDDWHARFSATGRRYMFRLIARRAPLTHDAGLVWRIRHELDVDAMRQGASHLLGQHDFTTFRSAMCQAKSPIKTLDQLTIETISHPYGQEYRFDIAARSFLHNQVRSFVGTLERVGAGAWSPDAVKSALEAHARERCGPVCPPDGLYLSQVSYASDPFQR
ncbi:MAG: tRNA pseudouridine(38-40) synthase TruA [Pseudomonadota bacterium]